MLMKIFNELEEIRDIGETAVALGNFDGVHYGHQKLIRTAVEAARARGLKSAVFTFSNHPKDVLPGMKPVKSIMFRYEKEDIIASLGVDYMFSLPFTRKIMKLPPEDFVKGLLLERLRSRLLVCGFNYRYGFRASGTPETLAVTAAQCGFDLIRIDPVMVEGNIVSSSLIRTLIASGQVERCPQYMGRHYAIGGEVVVGNRLGRRLGFPTSNLVIDEEMVTPPNGVYITYCVYEGRQYPSVTNVGVKPTIGLFGKNVETHIFDFDRILYGRTIRVEFLKKTRDEVKFDDYRDLEEQVLRDCREARAFHEKNGTLKVIER